MTNRHHVLGATAGLLEFPRRFQGAQSTGPATQFVRPPAALPKRTSGRSFCPEADRLVGTLADVDLLNMVLDGLRRLNAEGGAGDDC